MKDYFVLIKWDTDHKNNIETFKVQATYIESAIKDDGFEIPGYLLYKTIGITIFSIGVRAYLKKSKT